MEEVIPRERQDYLGGRGQGPGAREEGVEVLNLGKAWTKVLRQEGLRGQSPCVCRAVWGALKPEGGAEARLCRPLWARLRDLHFFLWENGTMEGLVQEG